MVLDIFKIGIGPSSSHTMGPWVACQKFLDNLDCKKITDIKVDLFGSLSKTGKGHGTDIAVILALLGYDFKTIDISLIKDYINQVKSDKKLNIRKVNLIDFNIEEKIIFNSITLPFHPNAIKFSAKINDSYVSQTYYSVGGGFVISQEDDISKEGEEIKYPYIIKNSRDLVSYLKDGNDILDVIYTNELATRSKKEIEEYIKDIWKTMTESIYLGCSKTGILPGGIGVVRRAAEMNKSLIGDKKYQNYEEWTSIIKSKKYSFQEVISWITCFALAVNEENASFGRVVTAPTNGSAGVIPAVIMYLICFQKNKSFKDIQNFILIAGQIGVLFKEGATISAAVGGCQAEIGVSSSMAAAGLTYCLGGSYRQVLQSAEIAMEHNLGLTCDPVNGLVQIPCIERNAMGAIKAITASNIALGSAIENFKVDLDHIIKVMKETAMDMNNKYKETSEAGLAINIPISVAEC
ncbi:MAG: L-serine dehydratase [Rickettsiales bacterium]|jgi:L-serine dehydratase